MKLPNKKRQYIFFLLRPPDFELATYEYESDYEMILITLPRSTHAGF